MPLANNKSRLSCLSYNVEITFMYFFLKKVPFFKYAIYRILKKSNIFLKDTRKCNFNNA